VSELASERPRPERRVLDIGHVSRTVHDTGHDIEGKVSERAGEPFSTAIPPLLEIHDLVVTYPGVGGRHPPQCAVDGVSLEVGRGETLGLVGESGSGKSTIGNVVLGLVRPSAGRIVFDGEDITHAPARRRRRFARHLQAVFQDPYGSLNPARTVGATLSDPLRVTLRMSGRSADARVAEALDEVGLPASAAARYPADFSAGQRQRIVIARALVLEPDIVICDEPTGSLDMSVQAQVLNLLVELQERLGVSYLFISHDMGIIRYMSDRVVVLHGGAIVESSSL
jgi:ABC-type glutathione transport system ATPase component